MLSETFLMAISEFMKIHPNSDIKRLPGRAITKSEQLAIPIFFGITQVVPGAPERTIARSPGSSLDL
ncbi:hypothetical protein D3C84_1288410 [compost metagenome]